MGRGWVQSLRTQVMPSRCFSLTVEEPQAGIGFPHLGTGNGMSPSLSPSISLRASALAGERGKSSVSAKAVSKAPSQPKEMLTFILDDASHDLLHGVLVQLLLFI